MRYRTTCVQSRGGEPVFNSAEILAYGQLQYPQDAACETLTIQPRAKPLLQNAPARARGGAVNATGEVAGGQAPWPELVRRLRAGDQAAMEDLYRVFSEGIRFQLWRQLGAQDLTDKVHDLFLIVTESIQNGELREPERLMGYVRTVVRRQIAGHIHTARQQRRNWSQLDHPTALLDLRPSPEHRVIRREYNEVALRILSTMRRREREVLVRFYLQEQAAPEICREMELTHTQFRLLKSRAKARLGKLCRGRMGIGGPTPVRPQPEQCCV
jgi:RNA polymerase sigma-70 factor, ECF subfamily